MKKLLLSFLISVVLASSCIALFLWRKQKPVSSPVAIAPTDLNQAVLEYAALGTPDDLAILIRKGGRIEATDRDKRTAFMVAAAAQNLATAEWLLSHGADINATAYNGSTALHLAIEDNRCKMIPFLLSRKISTKHQDVQGSTALMIASMRGHDFAITELLKAKAELEIRDKMHYTALCWAVTNSHRTAVKMLLEAGANANVTANPAFKTPLLFLGVIQNDIEILKLLLKHGADIKVVNAMKENALIRSLDIFCQRPSAKRKEYVKLLVSSGCNVNQQTKEGLTALMYAALSGDYELAQILIKHGASITQKDNDGNKARAYCNAKKHPELARLLEGK